MPSTTAKSPIQEIQATETEATKHIEEAKRLAVQEVEAFRAEEEQKLEEKKAALKKKGQDQLKAEKDQLGSIVQEGKKQTEKEVQKLKAVCEKKKPGLVQELIDQFLTLS